MTYIPPEFNAKAFTCPHCGVVSQFVWQQANYAVSFRGQIARSSSDIHVARCQHCAAQVVWLQSSMQEAVLVHPRASSAPLPHSDLPPELRHDFEEARNICDVSPRGAAALLRLVLQKLCKYLGESGVNINDDVAALVRKGLPSKIQQALDIVRVTGNNAVHPGSMDVADNPEIANRLFALINIVVENRITEPREIEKLYGALPEGARSAITRRDA
jgi:Domain of unknown function (DUF4145)